MKKAVAPATVKIIAAAAGAVLLTSTPAHAQQTGFYLQPSLTLLAVHDDNVYYTPENELADNIFRVTPSLQAGYGSGDVNWQMRYSFDSESYSEEETLDDSQVRQNAGLSLEVLPSSLLTLSLDANYADTLAGQGDFDDLDGDLGADLLTGRQQIRRASISPGMDYRLSATSTVSASHTFTDNEVEGEVGSEQHMSEIMLERQLSAVNTLRIGYDYRKYQYENDVEFDSHTPWLGFDHLFSPQTEFSIEAGPRISDESTEPFVLAALSHSYANGRMRFAYERDEAGLIGQSNRAERDSVRASLNHDIGNNLGLGASVNYGRFSRPGIDQESASAQLTANYRFNDYLSFTVAYDYSRQVDELPFNLLEQETARNIFEVGFTLTYPMGARSPRNQPENPAGTLGGAR